MNPSPKLEKRSVGQALFTQLRAVPDPRRPKSVEHRLCDLLFVALAAAVAGCDSWAEVEAFGRERLAWFRRFVPLAGGVQL